MRYESVTETTGAPVTQGALDMLYTRYCLAGDHSAGRAVLEVACGSGQGLGLLASSARFAVGGDISETMLRDARAHYVGRVPLACLDAQHLPFRESTFDTIVLFEAIYYLSDTAGFLAECRRVLRRPGALVVCTANREHHLFSVSPFSSRYYAASELAELLQESGFEADILLGFEHPRTALSTVLGSAKRIATRLGVAPRSMAGKALLKRLVYGRVIDTPPEVTHGLAKREQLVALESVQAGTERYRVVYAVARPTSGRA